MQRTANLITALTALALAVAFVAGLSFHAQRTDAAAATIAALNVGTCHTTDLTVLDRDDCNPHYRTFEFNRQGLDQAVKVDTLYATYAYDPLTSPKETPRGILKDSDLLKISIKDEGRDVRSGVLLISSNAAEASIDAADSGRLKLSTVVDATLDDPGGTATPDPANGPVTQLGGVVAGAIDGYTYDGENNNVPTVETGFTFKRTDADSGTGAVTINRPGIVELRFEPVAGASDPYKPIAKGRDRGEMRFFGKVADSDGTVGDQEFIDLGDYLVWDEDVVSGTTTQAPAFSLQANLKSTETITLRAIHYLTSQVEYMMGGERCLPREGIPEDPATTEIERVEKGTQAACTDDELGEEPVDYDNFKLEVTSDGNQRDRNVYLRETGRFTGVFQGFVRLTDFNGDGGTITDGEREDGTARIDWGREVAHAKGHADQDAEEVLVADAAVIGVQSAAVKITYKDTDGGTRTFEIGIDIDPPTIDVASPSHESRSDDDEINFSGSVNDAVSGLAEDSFALYVDHTNDDADDRPGSLHLPVDDTVLDGQVDPDDDLGDVVANSRASDGVIASRTEYAGFDNNVEGTFGVINSVLIYPMNDPANYPVISENAQANRKGIEAENYTTSDATFRDQVRINFLQREAEQTADRRDQVYNHAIDFHAVVRDRAGNVGFSDSDEASPRFINDLGTKLADRLGQGDNAALPNVLGSYSRHVVYIDNVDPEINDEKTVTGFYDVDSDGKPLVDRAGVMVVFDGPVDARSISAGTFLLSLGTGDDAESLNIVEAKVSGKLVFLKVDRELASDAEPNLTIAAGEEVRDLAGRVTRSDELKEPVEVNDGNLPVFTVALSEGSGLNTGAEGPARLTNKTIKVSITSDERIQGAPRVTVVCSDLIYPGEEEGDDDRDVSDYVDGLSGATKDPVLGQIAEPDCGTINDKIDRTLRTASSLSRGLTSWEYTWRQYDGDARVPDGGATVVVWGSDRSSYEKYDNQDQIRNWGSASAEFRFDATFITPLDGGSGGSVLPADDSDVAERRPFVLLDFGGEPTTVTVTELMVDGEDVTDSIDARGQNQFLYWPESLSSGEHEVRFAARDAANNKVENQSFKFEVTSRDPFILSLFAGWNAISFPADPKANTLDDIFGESAVERVIGWIPSSTTGPWAIATKADGVWMSSIETANLDRMMAQYGYWVYSTEFVDISVELEGPIDRETGDVPLLGDVPTTPGWNFVGVIDQDGDQTEGRAGSNLKDGIVNVRGEANRGQQDDIEVKDYLAGFARAYRWDVITNSYQVLKGSDNVKIGEGIWVYFDGGIAP